LKVLADGGKQGRNQGPRFLEDLWKKNFHNIGLQYSFWTKHPLAICDMEFAQSQMEESKLKDGDRFGIAFFFQVRTSVSFIPAAGI